MNCPRCKVEMKSVRLEDATVSLCPQCEGTWYPDQALASVTDHSIPELQKLELAPTLVEGGGQTTDEEPLIDCPECGKRMERYQYSLTCDLIVDECFEHGVWLDDGELGTMVKFLTDLNSGVTAKEKALVEKMSESNFQALQELSRSPGFYTLPGSLLGALNSVSYRDR